MNNEKAEVESTTTKRVYDQAPSEMFGNFMQSGWIASDLPALEPLEVVTYAYVRRQALSAAFAGIRLVLPSGNAKVRSNDTDYIYRPDTAFAYYSGVQGSDANEDAVLVMEPHPDGGHETFLYIHPRSTRDTDAFYRDTHYGELWVGRRYTLGEAQSRYQIATRKVTELKDFLTGTPALVLRGSDRMVDAVVASHPREEEFSIFISEQRLTKDEYEVREMQRAVDATGFGFNDVILTLPAAAEHP
ncbi:MAG: aminopeptidase P N-terminal domain-containing protein, partial [Candidatus Planktophila sp.]